MPRARDASGKCFCGFKVDLPLTQHPLNLPLTPPPPSFDVKGENDAFSKPFATAYEKNLAALIDDVRAAIGNPVLPVVIVQIGYWASTLAYGREVIEAQAKYVASDPRSILVRTMDLSRYYHFDPASYLVIGSRMARAAMQVAQGSE